jgi:hypothetical protein
MLNLIKIEVV